MCVSIHLVSTTPEIIENVPVDTIVVAVSVPVSIMFLVAAIVAASVIVGYFVWKIKKKHQMDFEMTKTVGAQNPVYLDESSPSN